VTVNPSTALGTVLVDELVRCGLREAVIAPGSRSAPLAMALHTAAAHGRLRLHVRIDERSASFLALGLAKASGQPTAVVCTSGTAAAHFHAAAIEADESGVPILLLTADRPPELRSTGANQAIDQIGLYGSAVRWFCEVGVPETAALGQVGYWRSLACKAWSLASGNGATWAGPVHLNLPLRDPLVPTPGDWPEPLDGRPDGQPWTRVAAPDPAGLASTGPSLDLSWTERGLVVAGDGTADAGALARLAGQAGWPLLAEPSSGTRTSPAALSSYQYLLDSAEFVAAWQPDVIVSAGRPGLSRGQLALLRGAGRTGPHVVLLQGPGRWSDPARTATHVAGRVVLRDAPAVPGGGWLDSWLGADAAARNAADDVLSSAAGDGVTEPALARDVAAMLPPGALLWVASSLPARDLDRHMMPRADLRVLASRGASGIDGLVSSAIGAALAHQAAGGGPAVALLGDLALVHDAPGLLLGPSEPRPDLCLVISNNDGGGIFSALEQAAFPDSFERVFGTPHGMDVAALAAAAGVPYQRVDRSADLPAALRGTGLRLTEVVTDRADGAKLRAAISQACATAIERASATRR
jgi:2-succinyl-5-enolpyruvyl-6-hydroxy-3-cyclohexene-1-carboxylate synthase